MPGDVTPIPWPKPEVKAAPKPKEDALSKAKKEADAAKAIAVKETA